MREVPVAPNDERPPYEKSSAIRLVRLAPRRRKATPTGNRGDRLPSGRSQRTSVHIQEVMAIFYNRLGIEVTRTTLPDLTGRPQYNVNDHEPIHELI